MSIHRKHPNPRRTLKMHSTEALVLASRFLFYVLATALVALALLIVAGCAAPGPQTTSNASAETHSSLLSRLQARQDTYCATADPGRRAVLLALIRTQVPTYPDSGLCTDAEQVVFKELARQAARIPPVDVEQAAEDQRRAQERLNERNPEH